MDNPFHAQRLPQDRESPPHWEREARMQWRYAYARAAETQSMNEVGQDCIVLDPGRDRLSFALCDGVSQSFFGDLAATALGDALVPWLSALQPQVEEISMQTELIGLLERLQLVVTEDVEDFPLPKDLPAMLLQVLDQKRRIGSESMFVGGRVWLPGEECPQGQVVLTWLGDMRCRVWRGRHEIRLNGSFRTEDRWSSRRGPVSGPPQHFNSAILNPDEGALTRVVVYSDGLAALDSLPQPPSDSELQSVIDESGRSPTSDDISFLDVVFEG